MRNQPMHKVQTYFTQAQYARLRAQSERTGMAVAEIVRRAVDHYPFLGSGEEVRSLAQPGDSR